MSDKKGKAKISLNPIKYKFNLISKKWSISGRIASTPCSMLAMTAGVGIFSYCVADTRNITKLLRINDDKSPIINK